MGVVKISTCVSPSAIKMYLKCPRMCKYYVLGYKQVCRDEILHGINVHKTISEYYRKLPPMFPVNNIYAFVYKIAGKYGITSCSEIDNFVEFEKWRISNGYVIDRDSVEKMYSKDIFCGVVDCIFKHNDRKLVFDWKTGNQKMNSDMFIQGTLYKFITDADDVVFVFLSGDKYKITSLSSVSFMYDIDIEYIKGVAEKIIKGEFNEINTGSCGDCLYNVVCMLEKNKLSMFDIGVVV